ncbi:hypothetical protein ACN28S_16035 [Cystobacter fuscus]
MWAVPDANGDLQHICANNVCFKLDGSPPSLPAGFAAEIQAHRVLGNLNEDVQNGGASSFGSRVAWAYGITAPASARSSKAMCWDMATDEKCGANFPVTVPVLYTTIFDPENPDCMWTNTDNGEINTWQVSTGIKGCNIAGATRFSFKTPVSVPRLSCDPESRVYHYKSFTLTAPAPSTYASATLTVRDSNGKTLTGWDKKTIDPANPVVDLSTLSTIDTGLTPSFDVAVTGLGNATVEPASEIRVTTGAPPQLCWDLSSPPAAACPVGPKLASTTASPPRRPTSPPRARSPPTPRPGPSPTRPCAPPSPRPTSRPAAPACAPRWCRCPTVVRSPGPRCSCSTARAIPSWIRAASPPPRCRRLTAPSNSRSGWRTTCSR